jgi:glyoxylase-like metal-dependent hydrolase (beta-lactamase superfamily II)
VLTHLHADHSGGACLPDGSPRFPNARDHVHPEDWSFFGAHRTPDDFTGRFAMAALEELGMLDVDPSDRDVVRDVYLRHAPGHAPGHRVVQLDDGNDTLLLAGDLLHVPPQVTLPAWPSNHDEDPEVASRSRAELVEAALTKGWASAFPTSRDPSGALRPTAGPRSDRLARDSQFLQHRSRLLDEHQQPFPFSELTGFADQLDRLLGASRGERARDARSDIAPPVRRVGLIYERPMRISPAVPTCSRWAAVFTASPVTRAR